MSRLNRLALGAVAVGALALSACSGGSPATGSASEYPEKDINFIVQAAAGGGSDLSSRALASELEDILGTSIVVENRPGASGSTAMQYVAGQKPDGYTIGFVPVEIAMLQHLDFDVDPADFDFLGQIMLGPGVLSVPADSPYQDFDAFVEAAKSKTMSVANSGAGSIWEAAAFGVAKATGAQVKSVPFDGGAPAVAAAIGGQVDAVVGGAPEAAGPAKEGQLRPLAVLHSERHPELPDVPTAGELGHDIEFGGWGGIYAPKELPDEVHQTLADAIKEAANSEGFIKTISAAGALPVYKTPQEFTDFIQAEHERFGPLLTSGG
jgi:tripartite-type tricarboxylate transporter receptor subunit TctC